MKISDTKVALQEDLALLSSTPNMRPFLFRTRFERTMIRLIAYAEKTNQIELYDLANQSLSKLRAIVDKSNTTAEGQLYSHKLLSGDIQTILQCI